MDLKPLCLPGFSGAGGARTHDPRISISASFMGFVSRNF